MQGEKIYQKAHEVRTGRGEAKRGGQGEVVQEGGDDERRDRSKNSCSTPAHLHKELKTLRVRLDVSRDADCAYETFDARGEGEGLPPLVGGHTPGGKEHVSAAREARGGGGGGDVVEEEEEDGEGRG
eukprot:757903-Hanusia_phi.AAC.1